MLFAAYNDTGFKVMLLLHILSVIVAFGPLFFMPMLARAGQGDGGDRATLLYLQRFATPAVVLAGFFGLAMVGHEQDQRGRGLQLQPVVGQHRPAPSGSSRWPCSSSGCCRRSARPPRATPWRPSGCRCSPASST